MLTRILLGILLLALVFRAIGRLISGIVDGASSGQRHGRVPRQPGNVPEKNAVMERDPVCGTFVVPARAISARGPDGTQYFCSEKCRQAYLSHS
jgi:YHS domain-containing protein